MDTYFLRTVPDIIDPDQAIAEKLAVTVRNTGNYFFEHAVSRQLRHCTHVTSLAQIPQGADQLILSMSNFISPHTDLGRFSDAIAAKGIKQVIMIGAGAQANSYDDDLELTDGTKRFLSLLSERSATIGVRGYYTKEILKRHGIDNTEVIGCPSIFWHRDRNFQITKPPTPEPLRMAFHFTPTGHYRDNISHLISFGVSLGATYIAQSEADLISVAQKPDVDDSDIEFMFRYYNDGEYTPRQLRDWFAQHTKWFFHLDEWFTFMRSKDFSLGARFHGNMAALQVNVPALNLVFDTRTRELCEFLNLPIMFLKDFTGYHSLTELYEMADYSLFNATFPDKYDAYVAFLERNGVHHRLVDATDSVESTFREVRIHNIMRLLADLQGKDVDGQLAYRYIAIRYQKDRDEYLRKLAEAGKFDARHC